MILTNFLVSILVIGSAVAHLSMKCDIIGCIDSIKQVAMQLQTTNTNIYSINSVDVLPNVDQIVKGLTQVTETLVNTQGVCNCLVPTEYTVGGAKDIDNIFVEAVRVLQVTLNIIIGKRNFFTVDSLVASIRSSPTSLEGAMDQFSICIAENAKAQFETSSSIRNNKNSIDGTLNTAINTYSRA